MKRFKTIKILSREDVEKCFKTSLSLGLHPLRNKGLLEAFLNAQKRFAEDKSLKIGVDDILYEFNERYNHDREILHILDSTGQHQYHSHLAHHEEFYGTILHGERIDENQVWGLYCKNGLLDERLNFVLTTDEEIIKPTSVIHNGIPF